MRKQRISTDPDKKNLPPKRTNISVGHLQARHVIVDRFCPRCVVLNRHIFLLVIAVGKDETQVNNIGNRETETKAPNQAQNTNFPAHWMMSVMEEDPENGVIVHQILPEILLVIVSRYVVTTHDKVRVQLVSQSFLLR